MREFLAGPSVVLAAIQAHRPDDGRGAGLPATHAFPPPNRMPAPVPPPCCASTRQEGAPPISPAPDADDMHDPAQLCRLVRSIASEAHRLFGAVPPGSSGCPKEVRRRIVHLQRMVGRMRQGHPHLLVDLGKWLDRLRSEVNERFPGRFS